LDVLRLFLGSEGDLEIDGNSQEYLTYSEGLQHQMHPIIPIKKIKR
jgi:hypothetical protein